MTVSSVVQQGFCIKISGFWLSLFLFCILPVQGTGRTCSLIPCQYAFYITVHYFPYTNLYLSFFLEYGLWKPPKNEELLVKSKEQAD